MGMAFVNQEQHIISGFRNFGTYRTSGVIRNQHPRGGGSLLSHIKRGAEVQCTGLPTQHDTKEDKRTQPSSKKTLVPLNALPKQLRGFLNLLGSLPLCASRWVDQSLPSSNRTQLRASDCSGCAVKNNFSYQKQPTTS